MRRFPAASLVSRECHDRPRRPDRIFIEIGNYCDKKSSAWISEDLNHDSGIFRSSVLVSLAIGTAVYANDDLSENAQALLSLHKELHEFKMIRISTK